MTYEEFIKNHVGKAMDYDNCAGAQCVDLAKYYLDEVFGIKPGAWGDAHCYFDNFNARPELTNKFVKIANTPEFVPKQGDICVWKSTLNTGGWGHIAIATGEGNTTYFYSYDQNWTGRHDACTKIKHNYNHFAGVLRPKVTVLDEGGMRLNDRHNGVLAYKMLLVTAYTKGIISVKVNDDLSFDADTVSATNQVLQKLGYAQNGVAGVRLLRRLGDMVK